MNSPLNSSLTAFKLIIDKKANMIKTQPHVAVRSFLHRPKIYFQFLYHKECGLVGRYDNQRPTQKPSFLFRRPGEKQLLMAFEKRVEIRTREMMKKMQNKRKTHAIVDVCLTGKAPTLSPQPFYVSRAKRLIILSLFIFLSVLFACDSHQATPNVSQQQQARPAYLMAIEKGLEGMTYNTLRPLAEEGNASAQLELGNMYFEGLGIKNDFQEAAKWWQLAAEQGECRAQYNLGFLYLKGQGVAQNCKSAEMWWRKSANQGFVRAQFDLSTMYDTGACAPVKKNYQEAAKWAKLAAEQNYTIAQYNLGIYYEHGLGVGQNYKEAVKWYQKAAEQGDASAQNNLGRIYSQGKGVVQDYEKAVKWYQKAAAQGNIVAQFNLGTMYDDGKALCAIEDETLTTR